MNVPTSSTSKDARALKSAEALRSAFMRLLQTHSLDQITVRSICQESGVHYATFFRHYESKESLLNTIAVEKIAQLNKLALAIRETDDYEGGFHALFAYVEDRRDLFATLLNGGAGSVMREEWVRHSRRVADEEGVPVRPWLPIELGIVCSASLIAETIAWWVAQPKGAYSVREVTTILMRMLTNAVMTPD